MIIVEMIIVESSKNEFHKIIDDFHTLISTKKR